MSCILPAMVAVESICPWTTERYIPKIQYDIAGSVNDSLSYKTVQDACGFPNFDNR